MEVKLKDLEDIYNFEISKNVKNKETLLKFDKNKFQYLVDIKTKLESGNYDGGMYNIFVIKDPKIRVIMSQSVYDKVINHYVTRHILIPKLDKYLEDRNCATRKGMGTDYAVRLLLKDMEYYKRFDKFYFLKLDIKKYFYNIDHQVLLDKIKKYLNEEEYKLIEVIINSTDKEYVNKRIEYLENVMGVELPKYKTGKGLGIGNLSSQLLAVFYLNELQHYMRHDLHLRFVNYMDDYIIIHESKEYLEECLGIIKEKLESEYHLEISEKKTFISDSEHGISFLGYTFRVVNNKTLINLSKKSKQNIRKGIKRAKYLYSTGRITFTQYFSSIECYKNGYKFVNRDKIKHLVDRYYG